jgi:hypothetical protein
MSYYFIMTEYRKQLPFYMFGAKFYYCFLCSVSTEQRGDHRAGGEEEEGEAGLA